MLLIIKRISIETHKFYSKGKIMLPRLNRFIHNLKRKLANKFSWQSFESSNNLKNYLFILKIKQLNIFQYIRLFNLSLRKDLFITQ